MNKERLQKEVDDNYSFFKRHKNEISPEYAEKFVLIRQQKFIDYYSTKEDAITAGRSEYEDGLFSVQKVSDEMVDLGSIGYALHVYSQDYAFAII
ncbi:MAG: hypothetical protein OXB96_00670 [Candidatus Kaiserbacteria bacterium]|nr:hypothetical protein [Candidatus Kaiserbacteria bacterium]